MNAVPTAAGAAEGERAAEQQRASEALHQLNETLSTTLNSIGDGVVACDLAGAIVRMNPMAERLTGWASAEAMGHRLGEVFKIVDGRTRAPLEDPASRALRAGDAVVLPHHTLLVRRDGTDLPIADSCAPIRSAAGTTTGTVLVFRDMSREHHARQAEDALRERLIVAERMASVGTLAAGVAHEINNPLTYVMSSVELALEGIHARGGDGTSAVQMGAFEEMMVEARQGAERIRKIVRGLQSFSRGGDERRAVIDLAPVLELSLGMAMNEIRHAARLVRDFGPTPLIEVDESRLGQIFLNLLVNAAQAIPGGHSGVNEIRVVTFTDHEGHAVVEVRDTGAGISPAVLPRIFEPFFTTKAAVGGTGLGLSICRNMVVGMGGDLSVACADGRGTTFRLTLPAASVQELAPATDRGSTVPTTQRRATILIVDDEAHVGRALRRVLDEHDVTVVTRAHEALDLIASGKTFDVILSDLMMPQMSGMALYDELVKVCPAAAERMVFMTGGAFTSAAHTFLDRISNARLEKPFAADEVRTLVQKVSDRFESRNSCRANAISGDSATDGE